MGAMKIRRRRPTEQNCDRFYFTKTNLNFKQTITRCGQGLKCSGETAGDASTVCMPLRAVTVYREPGGEILM
jgi:hypothetical protein